MCEKQFLASIHQKWQWSHRNETFLCVTVTEPTSPSNKKVWHSWIEDLLNCATMFLFFYIDSIEGIFCHTKWDPYKRLKITASTKKLSQNFVEHVIHKCLMTRKIYIEIFCFWSLKWRSRMKLQFLLNFTL